MSKKITFPYNSQYPSVADLRRKAKSRIPKFAFDYLEGGCNEGLNLARNENDFDDILLKPNYLRVGGEIDMSVELFGRKYSAPFGISPIGLQGLMWPNAPEILAKAAALLNLLPFASRFLVDTRLPAIDSARAASPEVSGTSST